MEYTDNEIYKRDIAPKLPEVSYMKTDIIKKIINIMDADQKSVEQRYPAISRYARPKSDSKEGTSARKKSAQLVFSDMSTPKNDGSFNIYEDLKEAHEKGENIVETIYMNTMEFYGFGSLRAAEDRYLRSV